MSGIFLSYRRDDSAGWTGRLYEHLLREWGPDQVFLDIEGVAPGEDFRVAVDRTLETCDVVLVVIGPGWLDARDQGGHRRLDDPGDNHRAEVVAALTADVRLVPVLVGGAEMPAAADLPGPLHDLAFRNAAVIDDRRFASDVRSLLDSIWLYREKLAASRAGEKAIDRPRRRGPARGPAPAGPAPSPPGRLPWALALAGVAIVLVWGVVVPRDWHNESAGLRIVAAAVLVALGAVGLLQRRPEVVLAGALAGSVGLGLWVVGLLGSGHTMDDLFSIETDGVANLAMFAGAALVVVVALSTLRRRDQRPS